MSRQPPQCLTLETRVSLTLASLKPGMVFKSPSHRLASSCLKQAPSPASASCVYAFCASVCDRKSNCLSVRGKCQRGVRVSRHTHTHTHTHTAYVDVGASGRHDARLLLRLVITPHCLEQLRRSNTPPQHSWHAFSQVPNKYMCVRVLSHASMCDTRHVRHDSMICATHPHAVLLCDTRTCCHTHAPCLR